MSAPMLHDVEMTDRGGAWERVDAAAVTPSSTSGSASGTASDPVRTPSTLRLRRSRGPVIAALDGGGAVFQRRIRDVLVGSAVILVPMVALDVWLSIIAFDRLDPDDTSLPSFFTGDAGTGIEDVAVWLAAVFVSFATAVVGHFAAQILLGERFRNPVSLGRGLAITVRRLPAITVAWLSTHWWFPLVALLVVSADSDAIGALGFFIVPLVWFASSATLLVVPAMVGERIGPLAAVRRGVRLARLRFGVCLFFVALSTLLSALLLIGVATLVPLLESFGFVEFGRADGIVEGITVQMAVLVVVPLFALGTAQAYVEVRVAGEGLDLAIDADAAFGRHTEPVVGATGGGS